MNGGGWVARAVTRPGKAGVTERMRVQMVARSVGDGEPRAGGGQVAIRGASESPEAKVPREMAEDFSPILFVSCFQLMLICRV